MSSGGYTVKRDGDKWKIMFQGDKKILGDLTLEQAMTGCANFNEKALQQKKRKH